MQNLVIQKSSEKIVALMITLLLVIRSVLGYPPLNEYTHSTR